MHPAPPKTYRLIIVSVIALHVALLTWSSYVHSPVEDELGHFAAGISHWKHGTFRFYHVNPPLVRLLATIPASLCFNDDSSLLERQWAHERPEFAAGKRYIERYGDACFRWLRCGRFLCISFSVTGGIVCWWWARRLYGDWPGVIALSLWSFSPLVIAYGSVILPDLGAASIGLIANYAFWNWLQWPTWRRSVVVGMALGLAELTKFTWLILFVLWPIVWLVYSLTRQKRWMWGEARQLAASLLLSIFVINLGYGFEQSVRRLGDFQFLSPILSGEVESEHSARLGNRFSESWIGQIPVPLPMHFVTGADYINCEFERGAPSYLRGQWQQPGWWCYYLYAMSVKIPLGTLAIIVFAAFASIFGKNYSAGWFNEMTLFAPAVGILLVISLHTGINHHVRYALPALPFLFIWSSKIGKAVENRNCIVAIVAGVALTWSTISSFSVYPHSQSYFNELVGGPTNGQFYFEGTNIDDGRDLFFIKEWYDKHPEARPFYLAYTLDGFVDPSMVGITCRDIPPGPTMNRPGAPRTRNWPWHDASLADFNASGSGHHDPSTGPLPGWYAISVNRIHEFDGRYEYFTEFDPVDWIGYSTPVYHLTSDDCNRLRSKLGLTTPSDE